MDEDKRARLIRCARHGLIYDAASADGCVLCRPKSNGARLPLDRFLTAILVAIVLLLSAGIVVHLATRRSAPTQSDPGVASVLSVRAPPPRTPPATVRDDDDERSAYAHGAPRHELPLAAPSGSSGASGVFTLRAHNAVGRSGSVFVPPQAAASARPLLVLFHGTGASGADILSVFRPLAEARGLIVLAPDSGRSPDGNYNWQVPDRAGDATPDQIHVRACLDEVFASPALHIDPARVLALGHSGGGSTAAFVATTDARFGAFAVLHGGVFAGGLGEHRVPAWFSTGAADSLRPPAVVERAASAVGAHATSVSTHIYPGAHGMSDAEIRDVIAWWLGD